MFQLNFRSVGNKYCVKTETIGTADLEMQDPYKLVNCLRQKALFKAEKECACTLPFSGRIISFFIESK